MIFALLSGKGEIGAGDILRQASAQGEVARDLTYRLFTVCERKGWAQEALAYNSLVTSWSEISRLAHREASDSGLWEAQLGVGSPRPHPRAGARPAPTIDGFARRFGV